MYSPFHCDRVLGHWLDRRLDWEAWKWKPLNWRCVRYLGWGLRWLISWLVVPCSLVSWLVVSLVARLFCHVGHWVFFCCPILLRVVALSISL